MGSDSSWKARESCELVSDNEYAETFESARPDKPFEVDSRNRFKCPDAIPIDRVVIEALARLKTTARSDRAFVSRNGEPHRSIRTAFTNACKRANLTGVTPHILRHTFTSRPGMRGAGDRTLQALGRWKELKMTRRYVDLGEEHLRETVEMLADDPPAGFTTPAGKAPMV